MKSTKNRWDIDLAKQFKKRNNPTDLKEALFGKVINLNPVQVHIDDGQITLTVGDQLVISEWFQLRWNIDKTQALSSDVPAKIDLAQTVKEIHSYTGTPCAMPEAISKLANAIVDINTELLQLKLNLAVGDKVIIAPAQKQNTYILIDKVLSSSSTGGITDINSYLLGLVSEKNSADSSDMLMIADSASNNDTKKITVGNLLQNQVPNSRKINGQELNEDINITADDLNTYSKSEIDNTISNNFAISLVMGM